MEIKAAADIERLESCGPDRRNGNHSCPDVLTVADLLALNVPAPEMLIDGLVPSRGTSLLVGASKSGKTLLAVQAAIAVARGIPLFGYYKVLKPGPVMIVEQDDPAGAASIKTILQRSAVVDDRMPFHFVGAVPWTFGEQLLTWLDSQIVQYSLRLVVLDSYTALRGSRRSGVDIVKAEQQDLTLLDTLAKRRNCANLVIHHSSKGSAGMHWSEKAAGTFAMSAATEAQIFISRLSDMESTAPERLVQVRGRHQTDVEMVLRFRKTSLDYEHVLEGSAAPLYPVLQEIKTLFNTEKFTPKDFSQAMCQSIATAHRQILRLLRGGALRKLGHGQYSVAISR